MRKKTILRLIAQLRKEAATTRAKWDTDYSAQTNEAWKKMDEAGARMRMHRANTKKYEEAYAEYQKWNLVWVRISNKVAAMGKHTMRWIAEELDLESDAKDLEQALNNGGIDLYEHKRAKRNMS